MSRSLNELISSIARVCHEANRALCCANGDFSQDDWIDAPAWRRESCEAGVRYHIANPDSKPSDGHNSWLAHKLADGWSYGAEDCAYRKTHPCMVPFEDLSAFQQSKDFVFLAIVRAMTDERQA